MSTNEVVVNVVAHCKVLGIATVTSSSFYLVKQVTKIGSQQGVFPLRNGNEASPSHLGYYTLFEFFRGIK